MRTAAAMAVLCVATLTLIFWLAAHGVIAA